VGLIESRVSDNDLICREWLEDELVLVSNVPIPKIVKTEDLYDYRWIFRDESSLSRQVVPKVFKKLGVSYRSFDVIAEVSDTTIVLQTIKKSKKIKDKPIVAVISKYAIIDEVAKGELFEARFQGHTMTRKFFIAYSKEDKRNAYVDYVVDYLLTGQCHNSV
jgi:DNA-binding transcriptional LysR family regulator